MKATLLPAAPQIGARPILERFARILLAIQTGSYPNARKLAADLEVSAKTIQRDVEFLRDRMHYPIEYDCRRWGYFLGRTFGPAAPAFIVSRSVQPKDCGQRKTASLSRR